jgi:lipoyl(octanoyl) transferase
MEKQKVLFRDLGVMDYKTAWDYQEGLLQENVRLKSVLGSAFSTQTTSQTSEQRVQVQEIGLRQRIICFL